jgi:hypothetical protein
MAWKNLSVQPAGKFMGAILEDVLIVESNSGGRTVNSIYNKSKKEREPH